MDFSTIFKFFELDLYILLTIMIMVIYILTIWFIILTHPLALAVYSPFNASFLI